MTRWPDFPGLTRDQLQVYDMIKKNCVKKGFGGPDKSSISADNLYLSWIVKRRDGSQTSQISISKSGYIIFKNILELEHGMHEKSHLENFDVALQTRFSHA